MSYFNTAAINDQIRQERALANIRKLAAKYEWNDGCDEDGFDVVDCYVNNANWWADDETIDELNAMEIDLPF